MILRTHLAFAFLVGLLFLKYSSGNKILFMFLVLLSSVISDVDHPRSKIGSKLILISKPFNFLFGHRKLFHSILLIVILSLGFWWFFGNFWIAVFIGYMSHVLLDMFTRNGVEIFYPFKKINLKGFIYTGGRLEKILFYLLLVLIVLRIVKLIS